MNDTAIKELKKEGKELNREGWKEEAKGQAQKLTGEITGNEMKEEVGRQHQLEGNAMKHQGKAVQNMADAAKEQQKAQNPRE